MKPILIDWGATEDLCVRIGWGLGWTIGIVVALVGFAAGGSPELAALRGGLALVVFVLLGWATGVLVSQLTPTGSDQGPAVGTQVDRTVGEDVVWPEPEASSGDRGRGINAA